MNWNNSITSTTRLKILTIIFHGIILVGMGHGILIMGLLIFYYSSWLLPSSGRLSAISFHLHAPFDQRLPVILICVLMGELLMLLSILLKHPAIKLWMHIFSLILLCLSIVYFRLDIKFNASVSYLSAVPFFICALIVFVAKPLKRLISKFWKWV